MYGEAATRAKAANSIFLSSPFSAYLFSLYLSSHFVRESFKLFSLSLWFFRRFISSLAIVVTSPTMPAFDDYGSDPELLSTSPTRLTASNHRREKSLSPKVAATFHRRLATSHQSNTLASMTCEVFTGRSPYGHTIEYAVSPLLTPSKHDRHPSHSSWGTSLPNQLTNKHSGPCSVVREDHDPMSFRRKTSFVATIAKAQNMAFVFDIDGVLVRGDRLIPEARRALQILNGDNSLGIKIPHIFLTNGGGKFEEDRCAHLTKILNTGFPVSPDQLIQSHTPMQALKEHHSTVLIIGGEGNKCKYIAQSYGFTDVVVPHDIVAWDATIAPFKKLSASELAAANPRDFSKVNIDAILVFNSSRDYATDLQIIIDLLRSSHGRLGTIASDLTAERIPIYFSNGDMFWPTEHFQPRLSQGTFRIALEAMYKSLTGLELERVVYGKPERATYSYAEKVLASWVNKVYGDGPKLPENVYMIGDNPASDICGGNLHGWHTCLVKTGVFQSLRGENDDVYPASFGVFNDVLEAVTAAVRKELGKDFKFALTSKFTQKDGHAGAIG